MGKFREQVRRIFLSVPLVKLYAAYSISCIGDRLWSFAVVLLLEHIGGIRLVCLDQLIEEFIIMASSSFVGNWLDRHTRRKGTLAVLAVNNVNVALSAALIAACIKINSSILMTDPQYYAWHIISITCLVLAILFCSIACLASEGEKLAFTKDWIVVMTAKEKNTLSVSNAMMKTIDLSTSTISPLACGIMIDQLGHEIACLVFVIWNLVSWGVEGMILCDVYNSAPELAVRAPLDEDDDKESTNKDQSPSTEAKSKRSCFCLRLMDIFYIYWSQSIFTAAMGLALLYMTVLGFDGIAVGYGKARGLTATWLGILRSFGAVCGIIGSLSYTNLETRIGVRKTGLVGLVTQQLALYVCIASIWLPGSPFDPSNYFSTLTGQVWWEQFKDAFKFEPGNMTETSELNWTTWTANGHSIISVFTLLMGIAAARFGLYMADLSVTQLMQEKVPERQRGTVFGVQDSVCQFFSVLKDIMVLILPDPKTFGVLIIVSVIFVIIGFIFYISYLLKTHDEPTKLTKTSTNNNQESSSLIRSSSNNGGASTDQHDDTARKDE